MHKDGWFCYNASNQKRDVVLTFAVGDSYTKDIAFTINGKDFDSEFDTCYFEKDYGNLLLQSVGADNVICNGVQVTSTNDNYSLKIQGSEHRCNRQGRQTQNCNYLRCKNTSCCGERRIIRNCQTEN